MLGAQVLARSVAEDGGGVLEKTDAVGQDLFAAPDPAVAGHQNVDFELTEGAKRLDPSNWVSVAGEGWSACDEISNEGDALAREVDDRIASRMAAHKIKDLNYARVGRGRHSRRQDAQPARARRRCPERRFRERAPVASRPSRRRTRPQGRISSSCFTPFTLDRIETRSHDDGDAEPYVGVRELAEDDEPQKGGPNERAVLERCDDRDGRSLKSARDPEMLRAARI